MKSTKSIIFILALMLGMVTFTSTTCNKTDNPSEPDCAGYAQATATGNLSQSFCFDANPQYTYDEENQRLNFSAVTTVDGIVYSCDLSVYPYTGTQSYSCGADAPGYVELVIHGDENEYYKSQSGTLEITQADATHLTATFNVVTKGYNNGKTVNLTGSVSRVN